MQIVREGRWFTRRELVGGVDMLTEPHVHAYVRANVYVVRGRDRDLVVDTGMGLGVLTPALGLAPGKPVLALATHIHLDHVGSLHEFADRAGPASAAEGFETMPDSLTYADMFRTMDDPVSMLPDAGWTAAEYRIQPAPLTMPLGESDTVDLGDRAFRVLELPGHSPDSIGLFDERDGTFFCGDAIYDDLLIDDLPDSSRADYARTMARIAALPASRCLGGHGNPFDARRMREIASGYVRRHEG
jgi:glyoxylase-like metal-dependent hydrolase (beta-lactamase superfamily II)